MSEVQDRRQRAAEAFQDASGLGDNGWHAAEIAIETATRVRITSEIIDALYRERGVIITRISAQVALKAAFEAAGFEVEP